MALTSALEGVGGMEHVPHRPAAEVTRGGNAEGNVDEFVTWVGVGDGWCWGCLSG